MTCPRGRLRHPLSSQATLPGGVIRRRIRDVDRLAGRKTFLAEMRRRGLAVAADAGQFAIFGNREPLRRLA